MEKAEKYLLTDSGVARHGDDTTLLLILEAIPLEAKSGTGKVVGVYMVKPQRLKKLSQLLQETIQEYEQVNGPIAEDGKYSPIQQEDLKNE